MTTQHSNSVVFVDSFGYSEHDGNRDDAGERAYALQQELVGKGWSEVTITDEWVTADSGSFAVRGVEPQADSLFRSTRKAQTATQAAEG